jgi:hypothetical protein
MVDPISGALIILIFGFIPLTLFGVSIWALCKRPTYRGPASLLLVGAVFLVSQILIPVLFKIRPRVVDELLAIFGWIFGPVFILVAVVWIIVRVTRKVT